MSAGRRCGAAADRRRSTTVLFRRLEKSAKKNLRRRAMRGFAFLITLLAAFAAVGTVRADEIEVIDVRLAATEDGVVVGADFAFDLNPRLAEVVTNGVPLYFVVDSNLAVRVVLVRREGRRQASSVAPVVPRLVAPLPALHRRIATELRHARGSLERVAPRAQLACRRSQYGAGRRQLRCRGAHAGGRRAAA